MMEGNADEGLEDAAKLLDPEGELVVSLDIDGPIKPQGPYFTPHEGSEQAIADLIRRADGVVLNSGKPVDYQRELRRRMASEYPELEGLDLIGGLGSAAEIDGQIRHFGREPDVAWPEFADVNLRIIEQLAEKGYKANFQNNRSYDVGVVRVEAENGTETSRGHSAANPMFSDISTRHLYDRHLDTDGFRYIEDMDAIAMTPDAESVTRLCNASRVEEPFVGLRFQQYGDEVIFYRDPQDLEVDEEELRQGLEHAVENSSADMDYTHHSDGGFEYWSPEIGKRSGLETYLDENYNGDVTAVHLGDSGSDMIDSDRIVSVPQRGTALDEMVDDERPRARNVSDFSDMMRRVR